MQRCIILALLTLLWTGSSAQILVTPDPQWTTRKWDAAWIAPPAEGPVKGVYYFRKSFNLAGKPKQFIIHISADNRYRLFINGTYITDGPQLSDLRHWKFESIDVAGFLTAGDNTAAVQVWNQGDDAPVFEMGKRLALIIQGDNAAASVINTDKTWKCIAEPYITPLIFKPGDPGLFYQYYAAGALDNVSSGVMHDWQNKETDYSSWSNAVALQKGVPFLTAEYGDAQWELSPRTIPLMERSYQTFASIRRKDGIRQIIHRPDSSFTIPANQKLSILLDQGKMTTAFPELIVSQGEGSMIKAIYAEALFDDINKKGHRDSLKGKTIHGVYDIFSPDGGNQRKFTTLSYRAFRYVQLDITTSNKPLTIEKLGSWFTAYPFTMEGSFSSNDPQLKEIFDIGWQTARLCSYETYMDCPYWERLQYIGDTRIQALISYYVSGDDRLARNAISQFEWSLQYDGLTGSRYPSSLPQYIPNYSLVWVLMVHDYMMYRNDPAFVKSFLPGMANVLEHFKCYLTEDNMMKQQPYWDFIDHSFNTKKVLASGPSGKLTTNSLFYAYTLNKASEIFSFFGEEEQADSYRQRAGKINQSVKTQCWDANSNLFADTPDKKSFSSHSNILAVLCGIIAPADQAPLLKRVVENKTIIPTTLYFDFYLARAMNKAGAGDLYYDLLNKWKDLLKLGLTTFPEGVSRSDCHAWSASPDFEMLATFAGIESAGPGFRKVLIRPMMEKLERVEGSIPHWAGKLTVSLSKNGNKLSGMVTLPSGITGKLEWSNKIIELHPGENKIE